MKKLILLELMLLLLATTFQSDNPPGWYQQQLPVNDFVNDIFFLDSLNGWIVTASTGSSNDSGYIMKTSDGGNNWIINLDIIINLNAIQFINNDIGYAVGGDGSGKFLKTSNGGGKWNIINLGVTLNQIKDIQFVNNDTGWICSNNLFGGGIFKTTNGGSNWVRQLNETYRPTMIFFLNNDTGWASCNSTGLYRTTDGGANWGLQFNSEFNIESIFFQNSNMGWIRGGYISNTMGIAYTENGGFNWINAEGESGGFDIMFINDSIGYAGSGPNKIIKSINGGKNWGKQITPNSNNLSISVLKNDSLRGWAGFNGIIHTTDGGGMIVDVKQTGEFLPENFILFQNYPNPFNPNTIIKYEIKISGHVKIKIYDTGGKEIVELFDKIQNPGSYSTEFSSSEGGRQLSSGVYFYSMFIDGKLMDTKKMILLR